MAPIEIFVLLNSIFSKDGANINGLKIKAKNPTDIHIAHNDDIIEIRFPNNKPRAGIKKFITMMANVEKISLNKNGGWIKLEYFPEIPFSFEKIFKEAPQVDVDISDIQKDIEQKYGEESQRIANLCLQYAQGWATIASQAECLGDLSTLEKRSLKNKCVAYVKDNVTRDIEKQYGSMIMTYLLVFILIPAIARFVVTRLLEKYF